MNETLISLETAKLAKEKGFNLNSHAYYGCDNPSSGKSNQLILRDWEKWTNFGNEDSPQEGTMIYSAPTQSLLQKWIREVHKIHVCPDLSLVTFEDNNNKWYVRIDDIITNDYLYHSEDDNLHYNTYEETLEAGLYNALQLIK